MRNLPSKEYQLDKHMPKTYYVLIQIPFNNFLFFFIVFVYSPPPPPFDFFLFNFQCILPPNRIQTLEAHEVFEAM